MSAEYEDSCVFHRQVVSEARSDLRKHIPAYCFNKDQLKDIQELFPDLQYKDCGWYYYLTREEN